MKNRLDRELVRRKLVRSREAAQALIESNSVRINGMLAPKSATMVDSDASITIETISERFVSRAGMKLEGALNEFEIGNLAGKRALDAGASTGGFTEVLLRRGVSHVIAVDVGYGQIDWTLRNHPQVEVMDRTNIRELELDEIGDRVDLVVADLSFISLRLVIPSLIRLVEEVGDLILMVKPQFEVGKELVGKGGVVREAALWASAIEGVALTAWQQGWGVKALTRSQLPGMSGNIEFFLWLRRDADQLRESELQRVISQGSTGRVNSEGGEPL